MPSLRKKTAPMTGSTAMKDRSMFSFYFKVVGLCFLPIVLMMLWMAASSNLSMFTFLITMLSFGGVLLVVVFAIWLVNTMYGGKYMLIYQMNNEGITFSQTADQAAMTRAVAAASAAGRKYRRSNFRHRYDAQGKCIPLQVRESPLRQRKESG